MDKIKQAFEKVKNDIDFLKQEIHNFRFDLIDLNHKLDEIITKIIEKNKQNTSTHQPVIQTSSTHPSTDNLPLGALNTQNMSISIGNQGVSTDRQTDRQTDTNISFKQNPIENASEMLDSLDNIKKEIRLKFKRLTEQEWLIFSTIYQIEQEKGFTDYKTISKQLNLTESSIRDYVGRLIKKGIPLHKKRINNKNIQITISSNLKKIASLSTILKLREL